MFTIFSPAESLTPIVKQYVVINSLESIDGLYFLPNGGNFLIFNRGVKGFSFSPADNKRYDLLDGYSISVKLNRVKQFIVDKTKSQQYQLPIIIAELEPLGYFKLFGQDASLLNHTNLPMDDDIIHQYFSTLYAHDAIEAEIDYLNATLSVLCLSHRHELGNMDAIINKIAVEDHFETTVDELVKAYDCSRSTLERQFKKIVGMTPKNYIFIAKFCRSFKTYIEEGQSFQDHPYLYSDQSHMYAVFKKFLVLPPREAIHKLENGSMRIYQINDTNFRKSVG